MSACKIVLFEYGLTPKCSNVVSDPKQRQPLVLETKITLDTGFVARKESEG